MGLWDGPECEGSVGRGLLEVDRWEDVRERDDVPVAAALVVWVLRLSCAACACPWRGEDGAPVSRGENDSSKGNRGA